MSIVIPDEILHTVHMTTTELMQEIAILLYHRNSGKAGYNGRTHFFRPLNWTRPEVAKLAV